MSGAADAPVAGAAWRPLGKAGAVVVVLAVFGVVLVAVNLLHFRFFEVEVVFYATLLDVAVALAVTAAAVVATPLRRAFGGVEAGLLGLVCLLAGYAFAISGPTVIDRSLSVYILEKLAQRGGAIREDAFPGIFVNEYMPEHRLVDVRLTEQLSSGTIVIEDGCVRLTPWGEAIAAATRAYRTEVLPRRRVLLGEVTDDLTDPFRRSAPAAYTCD